MADFWDDFDKQESGYGMSRSGDFWGGLNETEVVPPKSTSSNPIRRVIADPLVGLAKGAAVGIPETVVGLLDIPTMGRAGKVAETVSRGLGLGDFKSANEMFDNLLTPETREAQQKVAEAKGFLPTIATAIQNPSSIVQTVAESIPSMVTGMRAAGAVSKLIGKPLVEAGVANLPRIAKVGGIAEGAITAGQNIEQVRQQTEEGTLTPSQVGINTLSGVLTGMIGVAGGKLAQRFGLEDVDTLFTGGRSGIVGDKEKGIFKKVLMGAFQEGILEELPQSMQEQISQNLALNKPIDDGVFEAGAMGMLAGFAQSTGANIAGSTMQKMKNELDPINQTIKKLVDETLPGELNAIGGWDNGKPAENLTPTAVSETPHILQPSDINYGEEIYIPPPAPTEPPPESFSTGLQGMARGLNVGQPAQLTPEEVMVNTSAPIAPENIPAPEPIIPAETSTIETPEVKGAEIVQPEANVEDLITLKQKYNMRPTVAGSEAAIIRNERSGNNKEVTQEERNSVGREFRDNLDIMQKLIDKGISEGKTEEQITNSVHRMFPDHMSQQEYFYTDGINRYISDRVAGKVKNTMAEIADAGNKSQEGKVPKPPITNQEQLKQRLAEGKRLAAEKRAEVASKPIAPAQTNAATFGEYARELGYDFPVEVEKTAGYPTVKFKELNKKLLKKNNTSFEQLYAGFKASKNLSKEALNETKTQTVLAKGEKVTPPAEAKSVITSEAHTVEDINGKKVNLKANDPLLIENNKDGTYQVHDGKDFTVTLKGLDQIKGKFSTEINIAAGGVTPQMREKLANAVDKVSEYIPDSLSSWFKQTSTNSIPPSDISQTNGTWEAPTSSTMNTLSYVLADRNIDLRDVTKSIEKTHGILTDQKNASLAETLFSGRLSSRIDDFVNNELHAVTKTMAKNGVSIAQIEEYLHARHAEEANNYLDSLPEGERKGDAGISTEDANTYLQSLDPTLKEKYEKIALMLDKVTHKNAQLLVDYGLESQETIDKWFSKYKHYVPLFREDIEERPGTGQGFTVAGSASKGRTGSERKVVHILSNIAMQRERTLTRGEKNRVSQSLVSLAENFPNEDFWKVIKIPRLSTFIAEGVEAKIKPNVVVARVKDEKTGEIKHIGVQFNEKNERAARMAAALKNMDMDTMGEILGNLGKITRYVSAINTQYNPVFGVTNFFRDMGTAAFNLSTTPIAGKQKTVLSNVLPAMKGIWQSTKGDESSEMAKMFKDFQLHGGQTGYRNLFVVSEDRAKDIERELKSLQAGKPKRYLSAFAKILSDYNTMSENSIRLSAYKVGIESGMTKDQAASMAKNLTVNFNKKGQIAGQAGALYAFFNASVQGAVRMYETLKGPLGRKIIAGGIILGATQAMMLAAAGFKDEEPPEFVKERNIIIPIGGKKYLTFPMPLGFNVIPNVGRILAEITLGGGKNAGIKMSNLVGMITETFNPMGSSGLSMQTVAPTFLDPFAALAENKDWTGRPIYKEDFNALNPTPGPSKVKDSATVFGRGLAWAFNILTGGDKYTPGMFSPTADQIDYLGGQITGGLGREIGKTSMMFESLYTGNELPTYRLPLTGRFYGSAEGQANESAKYYSNLKKLNVHESNIKGRIKDREPIGEYIRDNPEAKLWRMANTIENTIGKIKKRKEFAKTPEAKKTYDKLISIQQKRLNDMVERLGN